MTFAERLRELRDAAGLSEARLAKASGVPFGSIHEYGLARRRPSFEAVVKIARALGTTCEAFADCEDVGGGAEPEPVVTVPPPRRGRPPKASSAEVPPAKKRGRLRKQP
jgi:transcriptional regulator with XRE-family HTH domain